MWGCWHGEVGYGMEARDDSELDAAFQAASKVLYEAASKASPAGDAGAAGGKKDDDAIDAEFEVKE